MNKTQLKNFAVAARVALIERVKDRARGFGIDKKTCEGGAVVPSQRFQTLGGELLTQTEISQRDALLTRIRNSSYKQVMEEAAYTWFNRFIALRYMQEHNLLPVSVRVLPDAPGALPELVRQAQNVELDGMDFSHVVELLEGNQTETLYTELLIALCNQLSGVLPQMFEPISDYTELLFPDGLLREDSVLAELARLKDEENDEIKWDNIKTIGWLYQYYNTELNELVYDGSMSKNRIPKELLSAATTIYTPHWPICYMVENSLGRLWLEGHDDPALRRRWRYYMDEAEQEPQVAAQLAQIRAQESQIQPEEIRLLDPCMGSGHILVYAFDVLMEIYRTQGYTDRDAVSAIVENNLYGLDIDDRAAQLAYFALMMKACEHDRRFLRRGIQPHVCAITEWSGSQTDEPAWSDAERRAAHMLRETFRDAKEFGSILSIPKPLADALNELGENLFAGEATLGVDTENLRKLAAQANIMAQKYDVVVTNPPYLGNSRFSIKLDTFIKKEYPNEKSDLSMVMFKKALSGFVKENGFVSFITTSSWMFLSSFEKLRKYVFENASITSLVDFGTELFDGKVGHNPVVAWVCRDTKLNYKMTAVRLVDYCYSRRDEKEKEFFNDENRFSARQDNFEKIPGAPVAYWVSEAVTRAYSDGKTIDELGASRSGMQTGNNDLFLKFWYEIDKRDIGYGIESEEMCKKVNPKYIPQPKGGAYRKWYGNLEYVVLYKDDGKALREYQGTSIIKNPQYYFREGISWSHTTSKAFSGRYMPRGCIFNVEAPTFYPNKDVNIWYVLGFLNTEITDVLFGTISQTMHYMAGDMAKIPVFLSDDRRTEEVEAYSKQSTEISREDWDSFETSWDFKKHPLI